MNEHWPDKVLDYVATHTPLDWAVGRHWSLRVLAMFAFAVCAPFAILMMFPFLALSILLMVWDEMEAK